MHAETMRMHMPSGHAQTDTIQSKRAAGNSRGASAQPTQGSEKGNVDASRPWKCVRGEAEEPQPSFFDLLERRGSFLSRDNGSLGGNWWDGSDCTCDCIFDCTCAFTH